MVRDPHLLPSQDQDSPSPKPDSFNLSQEVIIELVEHYINKLHDRPHSLFHLPTLRKRVRDREVNKALVLAICSLGSRFSADPEVYNLGGQLTAESKRLALDDFENISLESIQTCILIANICAADAKPSSEALFFRIATSMAQIVQLTTFKPGDSVVDCETRKRIWWSLFVADRWYSAGISLPRQISDRDRPTDLPMDETTFHTLAIDQKVLDTPYKPGLWAYMIPLAELFGPIQDLSRQIVQNELDEINVDRATHDLSCQLDAWEEMLPPDMKLTEENLELHKSRNTGGTFVALHFGFHHYSTLLHFHYLDAKQASHKERIYAERCKHHASRYSALLKFAREHEGFEAVYLTVAHMAVVSSSVLVHTLLFGDEDQISTARNSLNANFEALIELERYWPALKSMVQNTPLSIYPNSFERRLRFREDQASRGIPKHVPYICESTHPHAQSVDDSIFDRVCSAC
ncbi:hypothetical protein VF21_09172 [Pseudogymnoascus sp. 05NY08]|nr:hypothetical protein VF21_09172 [Pseudogymnoascus sp. 05NY08]